MVLNEEKTNCRADATKRRMTRVPSTGSRAHTITLGLVMGLSNIRMKNEEVHIDAVRDDKDIENGEVDDDEDEVVEIKTPSPPSSSSSLNGAAETALRPSAEIHTSNEFLQEQLGQKPPVQVPHNETKGESSEPGAGKGTGLSSAAAGRPRYVQSSRIRCTKRSTRLLRRKMHCRRYK